MTEEATDHTFITRFRIPKVMWEAYGRVTSRLGDDRTADLLDHIRKRIGTYGDERDLADLEAAEQELAERRSRKGGRPPRADSLERGDGSRFAAQLAALISSEGGVWDDKRALEACQKLGFYCTIQRARQILKKLAEQSPELLTAVEGRRWTYDAADATEEG